MQSKNIFNQKSGETTLSYTVEISNRDFLEVLKSTKTTKKMGKHNLAIEEVEFHFSAEQLMITVVGSKRVISASGSGYWTTSISLLHYRALTKIPPIADPLIIEFCEKSSRLKIGTTSFRALK